MAKTYRTQQVHIKEGHRLYPYMKQLTFDATNLYNVTNFYIRQMFTGLRKIPEERFDNETQALAFINGHIEVLNQQRLEKYRKKVANDTAKKEFFEFKRLSQGDFLNFELLDGIFRISHQVDYRSLPGQVNQQVMKLAFQNWRSYFAASRDYKEHPDKYTGKPRIPRYKKKKSQMTLSLTNQVCKIKEDKYLRFPKTGYSLNIGKYMAAKGNLQEVRVIPKRGLIILEVVFSMKQEPQPVNPDSVAAIDLGVNNLVSLVNNKGLPPLIVKGRVVKSINHYYNQQRSKYYSMLRMGIEPEKGPFTSNRLNRMDLKRHLKIKDYFHKVSYHVVNWCIQNKIGTLVIGKNKGWKENVQLHMNDKQNFTYLPFGMLIGMLTYKAKAAGIQIIIQEESYTSKASFVDGDVIPVYGEENREEHSFSGKRISRGLYRTKDRFLLNADVNGALNILQKAAPKALNEIRGIGVEALVACMSTPLVLKIA